MLNLLHTTTWGEVVLSFLTQPSRKPTKNYKTFLFHPLNTSWYLRHGYMTTSVLWCSWTYQLWFNHIRFNYRIDFFMACHCRRFAAERYIISQRSLNLRLANSSVRFRDKENAWLSALNVKDICNVITRFQRSSCDLSLSNTLLYSNCCIDACTSTIQYINATYCYVRTYLLVYN